MNRQSLLLLRTSILLGTVGGLSACGGSPRQAAAPHCPEAPASVDAADTTPAAPQSWVEIASFGGHMDHHETAFVEVGGKFYLISGMRLSEAAAHTYMAAMEKPHDMLPKSLTNVFDPQANRWETKSLPPPPVDLHHSQPAVIGSKIYFVAGLSGIYPKAGSPAKVNVFDTQTGTWTEEGEIPEGRRRGAAGAVVIDGKIYVVGGLVGGHGAHAKTVDWFNVYDPSTKEWKDLPALPHARDHFYAVASADGSKLVVAGGRTSGSDEEKGFPPVPEVDVYDFASGTWSTLPAEDNLPTPRGGCSAVRFGDEMIVLGGESFGPEVRTFHEVEALNLKTFKWRQLPRLNHPRHGAGVLACGSAIYVAGGAGMPGPFPILHNQEALVLDPTLPSCSSVLPRPASGTEAP